MAFRKLVRLFILGERGVGAISFLEALRMSHVSAGRRLSRFLLYFFDVSSTVPGRFEMSLDDVGAQH